jgi:hypothetical protein
MNCQECIDLLQEHLDGSARDADGCLRSHLATCPECAARFSSARVLNSSLRLSRLPSVPSDLTRRIATNALRDIRRRRLARRVAFITAAAAAVLMGIGVRSLLITEPPVTPVVVATNPDSLARPRFQDSVASSKPMSTPPLRNAVAEAGDAVASLTSRTADEAMGQTRLFLPLVPSSSLRELEITPPSAPSRPLREAGENISSGLGPVASSARRAVDLFLRDIPPVGTQSRGGS